jgi:hypothetical protein
MLEMYVNFSVLFKNCKHHGVEIFVMINDKEFGFIRNGEDACIYKKLNGALRHISNNLCRWHIVD